MRPLIIGSRGSPLALWQARYVQKEIEKYRPATTALIKVIRTSGDHISESKLAKIGSTKGLFIKEIEEALCQGQVDLAVHSLKDVPTELPKGLCLGAIPRREDPRDALVANRIISSLQELPHSARLATGSLRRTVQLQHLRPDLQVEPIRGNVDTRIRKMRAQGLDGVVLAQAGLKRLGLEKRISYIFTLEEMLPAISQGALAIEIRADDPLVQETVTPLEDPMSRCCTEAERLFLSKMGGGCQVPMAAYASLENGEARFEAFVASPSRGDLIRKVLRGSQSQLNDLALQAADYLLSNGGKEMLREVGY